MSEFEKALSELITKCQAAEERGSFLEAALLSIAKNRCCEGCQEAARVANWALNYTGDEQKDTLS